MYLLILCLLLSGCGAAAPPQAQESSQAETAAEPVETSPAPEPPDIPEPPQQTTFTLHNLTGETLEAVSVHYSGETHLLSPLLPAGESLFLERIYWDMPGDSTDNAPVFSAMIDETPLVMDQLKLATAAPGELLVFDFPALALFQDSGSWLLTPHLDYAEQLKNANFVEELEHYIYLPQEQQWVWQEMRQLP